MTRITPFSKSGAVVYYNEGDLSLERRPIIMTSEVGVRYHTITQGDTLLQISLKYYGVSSYWFIIGEVNNLIDPFTLTEGDFLKIPLLENVLW